MATVIVKNKLISIMYHEVEWDPDKVQRFWNYYAGRPEHDQLYFGDMFGDAVLTVTARHMPKEGVFVDLGCGPGFFSEKLLNRYPDARLIAVDSSEQSIDATRRRCASQGGRFATKLGEAFDVPLDADKVDALFLLEVIEHLDDDLISQTLTEVRRVLRPGGVFVLTTPNEENLEQSKVACPECGCVFHRMQHQQSLTAADVDRLLQEHGLRPIRTQVHNLGLYRGNVVERGFRAVRKALLRARYSKPHLLAISYK